jgi:flagellar hook protein FlgE
LKQEQTVLDSIFIGMSGLTGFSQGLRVVGNNLANVNTPGFKGSQLAFSDLFSQGQSGNRLAGPAGGAPEAHYGGRLGMGIDTPATALNLRAGELRNTGRDLDLAVDGDGFFILRDEERQQYTRAGQFQFDKDGYLVSATGGQRVAGYDESGRLTDVSLAGLREDKPEATKAVKLNGNLSTNAATDVTLNGIKLISPLGAEHIVKAVFKNNGSSKTGTWTVTVSDDTGVYGTGQVRYESGLPVAAESKLAFTFAPKNEKPFLVTLDLSGETTAFAGGDFSTIAVASQDGTAGGYLTGASIDADGALRLAYSNGQTAKGAHLALGRFSSEAAIVPLGGNAYASTDPESIALGRANARGFGSIKSGVLEGANVDLAEEFGNLILMQRGYQASSHVISTANEMIQQLFDMKGHR